METDPNKSTPLDPEQQQQQQDSTPTQEKAKVEMLADEDPLLISQSLTYVTDDGSVLHSFASAPFSTSKQPHW